LKLLLTGRQVYEIAKSLDGMLSMGSPTITGTDKLMPKTLMSQIASGGEYSMNKPVGAQMGKFVQQMQHLIERERQVARNQNMAFKQQLVGGMPESFTKRRQSDIDRMLNLHSNSDLPDATPAASVSASGHTPESRLKRIQELKAKQGIK
jgi:hypothetical protein